ncbi:hypothetical protein Ais01nite_34230 [Asanoa ishikariensis]|uniref:Beta-lactamase enzyme family protein n=1 Tax=Asanoa ishikariensis TaxID=137265 RepID=A0A1H3LC88_9ACTN|nr:hypothetical protein [Asanoa ishikariensis]GIF65388.1 hypothetical protein Ais01nite_34230 [Asanoa ishikariensis]SDY62011.1 hypothetical protein SAMN05421684_0665 [Asanoa ishikariensis]
MRPRVVMVLAIAALLLGGVLLVPAAYAKISDGGGGSAATAAGPAPTIPPKVVEPPQPTLAPQPVSVKVDGFYSWALMDLKTGKISGSKNSASQTSSTESMIKTWIVSDYLRQLDESGKPLSSTNQVMVQRAIRNSDDNAAGTINRLGGGTTQTKRMISWCGLKNTHLGTVSGYEGWWSFTEMSAQDVTRLGKCIQSGKAAGKKYTPLVLKEMTKVEGKVTQQQRSSGGGRWGVIDGLPKEITTKQGPISIKNGWTPLVYDNDWHISCMAISKDWVLAVQTRYPISQGLAYGAKVCQDTATQLVTPKVGAALKIPSSSGSQG